MDDSLKQKGMIALVAFNLTLVAYQVAFNSNPFSTLGLLFGIGVSLAVGAIAFGVVHLLGNR